MDNHTSSPRLEYAGNARGGEVNYIDGETRLTFWHEIGGGDCKMYISIPDEASWEKATKTPLAKRREILLFIASTARREQAPSWRFEINETSIDFF